MRLGGFLFRQVVRVFVPGTVPQLAHESRGGVADVHGDRKIAELTNVFLHLLHGNVHAVVFGGSGQIVREPAKLEFRLGHSDLFAHVVDHVGVRKRLGIGKTHVLCGKIQHPSGHVAGIFSSSEHAPNVVYRGVAIGIAQRFVHGGNVVVVVLAVAVVREDFPRAVDDVIDGKFSRPLDDERLFENRECETEVAVGFSGEKIDCRVGYRNVGKRLGDPFPRGFEAVRYLIGRNGFERENLRAGQKRPNDGEAGILGSGSDEGDYPLFDVRQKRILLGFVPTVDFVEKQDGALAFQKILSGLRDDLRQILLFADDSGKVEEFRVDGFGYEVGEAGFSGSRRPPENHGNESSGLEDFPYGRAFSHEVFLTDEFVEIPRSENG